MADLLNAFVVEPFGILEDGRMQRLKWKVILPVALVVLIAVPLARCYVDSGTDECPGPLAEDRARDETPDFNGDGLADLAIPAPYATVGGVELAGAISVVYGGRLMPDIEHSQVITRSTQGDLGRLAASGTGLGSSVVVRDLNPGYSAELGELTPR
jgi:hypothetical protein